MSAEVDAENKNAASQEIIHLDAELEEDIGAEIEDLTLTRRLGQHEDAVEVINTVLLRHVRHFPVFAEITGYLWRRDDLKMLDDVCSSLQQPDSTWEPTEVAYFEYMVGEKDRGSAKMNNAYLSEGVQRDPTSLQFLEAYLHTAPSERFCPTANSTTVEKLATLFDDFVKEELWWDAANIFEKFCEHYPVESTKNADEKFILNLYDKAGFSQPAKNLLVQLEEDFEFYLPKALAILSAKAALMLYVVRIYDTEVEVLVKFVFAGMPPLRTLSKEVQDISYELNTRLGFDYTKSDYYTLGETCVEYWKYSEGCAGTIRLLNKRLRKLSVPELPEIAVIPFQHWLRQPPAAVNGMHAVTNPKKRSLETYLNFPVHKDSSPGGKFTLPPIAREFFLSRKSSAGCLTCRRQSLECDGSLPKCSQCSSSHHACSYDDSALSQRDAVRNKERMGGAMFSESDDWDHNPDHNVYYV